jgi:large subunit ribosomal protein L24
MHVRKKDVVQVIAGKDKGREGEVIKVLPKKELVFVSRINMIKRHTKASQKNPQGGIVEKEGGIHISNVKLIRREGADAK